MVKVASPNLATSKKSAEDKCPCNLSPAASVIFKPATLITKLPPTNLGQPSNVVNRLKLQSKTHS